MKKIIFHPLAKQELTDAIGYYQTQGKPIALEFLNAVEFSTNLLTRYPELGLKFRGSVRRLVISKFPYSLLYRLLDDEQVYVLAIAHHKQKPSYWCKRK